MAILPLSRFQAPADAVDCLAKSLFARPLTAEKREKLTAYVNDLPPIAEWADRKDEVNRKLRTLLVLMLTTPEYQMS